MVDNLDDLPFPDWNYYTKKYALRNNFLDFNSKTAIPITATRGCPYSCFNYCTYPLQQGRKVRFRSVQNVVKEMKHWISTLGTNKFIFRDKTSKSKLQRFLDVFQFSKIAQFLTAPDVCNLSFPR